MSALLHATYEGDITGHRRLGTNHMKTVGHEHIGDIDTSQQITAVMITETTGAVALRL